MYGTPQPDERLSRLIDRIGSQYEFLALLGQGGAGSVYEVRNRVLDRREALKLLADTFHDTAAQERFQHEAKTAAALEHPNIVNVHAFGETGGLYWFTMRLIEGPSLAELFDRQVSFDATMCLQLAMPLLDALAYSHAQGVIHRDIKPANILFTREGRPCLADFGVAKSDTNAMLTRTGQIMGTPAYVAPEQALGERVDARADLYALGMTFYKALTGRLPFSADHALQTLVQRLKEDPKPLRAFRPDLDPELESIVMRALRREREERWPEARAMGDALLTYAQRHALPWSGHLAQASAFELPRTPIAITDGPVTAPANPTPSGSLDPTLDFPQQAPTWRRGWIGVLATVGLVAIGWTWTRFGASPAPPSVPAPQTTSAPQPPSAVQTAPASAAVPSPAPTVASTPAPRPVPAPAAPLPAAPAATTLVRRPAVYPELLEGHPVPLGSAECAGQKVNVSLLVGEDGTVKSCKILSKVSATCAEAARAAAMRYRFRPAMDAQGKPLETSIAAAVDFPEAP